MPSPAAAWLGEPAKRPLTKKITGVARWDGRRLAHIPTAGRRALRDRYALGDAHASGARSKRFRPRGCVPRWAGKGMDLSRPGSRGSAEEDAVRAAIQLVAAFVQHGPDNRWDAPSRVPAGRILRKFLLRSSRPYVVRQRELERALDVALKELAEFVLSGSDTSSPPATTVSPPAPPEELVWRVTGQRDQGAFLNSGLRTLEKLELLLGRYGG